MKYVKLTQILYCFLGMSWHIMSFERIVKEKGKFMIHTEVFIQLIQGQNKSGKTKQDSDAVIALILKALEKYKKYNPEVKKAILKADNAGNILDITRSSPRQ